jgi:hypothetical protein
VISHTAPSEGAKEILKDFNGSYFLNKHGDVEIANVKRIARISKRISLSRGISGTVTSIGNS